MGYGYSVWYVPCNYRSLKAQYGMTHIPHVTVSTNHIDMHSAKQVFYKLPKQTRIELNPECVEFPKMYENDPLSAIGWYVDMPEIKTPHRAHLTLRYFTSLPESQYCTMPPTYRDYICFKVVADTRSLNPKEWRIIKKNLK